MLINIYKCFVERGKEWCCRFVLEHANSQCVGVILVFESNPRSQILAAGDQGVLDQVAPIFDVLGKKALNLGAEVGAGARMKLCVNAIMGSFMTALGKLCACALCLASMRCI